MKKHRIALACQSEARGEMQSRVVADHPRQHRRNVVSGVVHAEGEGAAQASVHFRAENEVLATEPAIGSGRESYQGMRSAKGISEFHTLGSREILRGDEVLGDIPVVVITGKKQFAFQFVNVLRRE